MFIIAQPLLPRVCYTISYTDIMASPTVRGRGGPNIDERALSGEGLSPALVNMQKLDPTAYKGVLNVVRIGFSRFFPIHPYTDLPEVQRGAAPDFVQRV